MTYPWAAGEVLLAGDLNSAFAAKTDLAMTQNAQTGVSYSFALADASKLLTTSNASPVSVTVTKQATVTWVTGTQLRIMNLGAGVTTLVADTGVTINNNKALAQYQGGTLIRTASDVWLFVPTVGTPSSATATVAIEENSTSATYADLPTVGPAATITTGTKALVIVTASLRNNTTNSFSYVGYAISGATTRAASDATALYFGQFLGTLDMQVSRAAILTDLTAGSNTFTLKYRRSANTSSFIQRQISVIDLGS